MEVFRGHVRLKQKQNGKFWLFTTGGHIFDLRRKMTGVVSTPIFDELSNVYFRFSLRCPWTDLVSGGGA